MLVDPLSHLLHLEQWSAERYLVDVAWDRRRILDRRCRLPGPGQRSTDTHFR